jgi:hypothetical protein
LPPTDAGKSQAALPQPPDRPASTSGGPGDLSLFIGGQVCGPFTQGKVWAMVEAGTVTGATPAFRNLTDVWAALQKLLVA